MTLLLENVSVIQQKRIHAEREQSKKITKLVHEQLLLEDDESYR